MTSPTSTTGSGARGRRRPDGSWSLSGLLRPDEVEDLTGIELPDHEDYDTIAGSRAPGARPRARAGRRRRGAGARPLRPRPARAPAARRAHRRAHGRAAHRPALPPAARREPTARRLGTGVTTDDDHHLDPAALCSCCSATPSSSPRSSPSSRRGVPRSSRAPRRGPAWPGRRCARWRTCRWSSGSTSSASPSARWCSAPSPSRPPRTCSSPCCTPLHVPESLLHPIAFAVGLAVVVYLHVVLGEMIPKNIALAGPDRAALVLGTPIWAIVSVTRPVIRVRQRARVGGAAARRRAAHGRGELDVHPRGGRRAGRGVPRRGPARGRRVRPARPVPSGSPRRPSRRC